MRDCINLPALTLTTAPVLFTDFMLHMQHKVGNKKISYWLC